MSNLVKLLALVSLLAINSGAIACSIEEKLALAKAGYTKAEIEQHCSSSTGAANKADQSNKRASGSQFDYRGTWDLASCELKSSQGRYRAANQSDCRRGFGSAWHPDELSFSLGENTYNKKFSIRVIQDDGFFILESVHERTGWPKSADIIDADTIRLGAGGSGAFANQVQGENLYLIYKRRVGAGGPFSAASDTSASSAPTNDISTCASLTTDPNTLPPVSATCRVLKPEISDRYAGDCKDGLAHGKGVAAGKGLYAGEFVNGKPHGHGVYKPNDFLGSCLEIDWVDGVANGKGTTTFKDGKVTSTEYSMGEIKSLLNPASWFSK